MLCKLCNKREVTDLNPTLKICSICRLELELAITYRINSKEVTKETYEQELKREFDSKCSYYYFYHKQGQCRCVQEETDCTGLKNKCKNIMGKKVYEDDVEDKN